MNVERQLKLKKFIEIYYLSPEEKELQGLTTQKAVCKAVGVTEPMYKAWAKKAEQRRSEFVKDDFDEFVDHMKMLAFNPKTTSKDRELYAKLRGWMVDKREDTIRFEPTTNDYNKWTNEIISQLRNHYEEAGGTCPVCGQSKLLLNEVCMDTEPQHSTES